jgi:osmotically-inducible protein OsmY
MDAASGGLAITSCPGRSQWSEGCRCRRRNEAAMRDDELQRDVTAELSWDPQVDSDAIEVSVASGTAALRGTAASLWLKQAGGELRRVAAALPGLPMNCG